MRIGEPLRDLAGDQRTSYQSQAPVQQGKDCADTETQQGAFNLVPRLTRDRDDGPLQHGRLGEGVAGHQDEHHLERESEDVLRSPDAAVPRLEHAGRGRAPDKQRDQSHHEDGQDDREQIRVGHQAFDVPDTQGGEPAHHATSFGLLVLFFRLVRHLPTFIKA